MRYALYMHNPIKMQIFLDLLLVLLFGWSGKLVKLFCLYLHVDFI